MQPLRSLERPSAPLFWAATAYSGRRPHSYKADRRGRESGGLTNDNRALIETAATQGSVATWGWQLARTWWSPDRLWEAVASAVYPAYICAGAAPTSTASESNCRR
jgi:hypothetical protein